MNELPRSLHVPEPVMLLLMAQARMGDNWAEAGDDSRGSMWATLHYRADKVREYYGLPSLGLPKPDHEF